jgi:hypothetical protein
LLFRVPQQGSARLKSRVARLVSILGLRTELVRMRSDDVTRGIQRSESGGTSRPSELRLACRMMLDAGRDASRNKPAVCNTAVLTGRMAPDSTPSAKQCEAPGNEQCWLSAWRDLARSLPGKNVSSVQCINGGKYGVPNTAADRLCGLVVSVADYKHRGPGLDSRALLRIFLRELGL